MKNAPVLLLFCGFSIHGASLTTIFPVVFVVLKAQFLSLSCRKKSNIPKNGNVDVFIAREMAKGRRFVPSKEKEGNWFKSRTWTVHCNAERQDNIVPSTTKEFENKAESPYKHFRFSRHDNRHDLQDHGVYFGNGLGKRFLPERSQHYSNNMITWNMNNHLKSNYTASYRRQTADGAEFRRFPKEHIEGKPGTAPLTTTTTQWFHKDFNRTPLHVLASTQEPLLPANSWIYSYRPKGNVWT